MSLFITLDYSERGMVELLVVRFTEMLYPLIIISLR